MNSDAFNELEKSLHKEGALPMMTRTHFTALAAALAEFNTSECTPYDVRRLNLDIQSVCAKSNPNFNSYRFDTASKVKEIKE